MCIILLDMKALVYAALALIFLSSVSLAVEKADSGGDAGLVVLISSIMVAAFAAIPILFILLWLVFAVFILAVLVFWVFMLVDCIKRNFETENEKILWILILVLTHWIGAIIYYFMVKRKRG